MSADETENDDREAERMRGAARNIFLSALSHTNVKAAFDRHVQFEGGVLRVGDDLYNLTTYSNVYVLAIGKAAHSMTEALVSQAGAMLHGMVVSSFAVQPQLPGFSYFCGGHPLPNAESIMAARAALRSLKARPDDALVIFLLSGGGSAIFEKPIDDAITLEDLIATYRALVHSGAPITEINAIRKHLSAVKGGRLAQAAAPAHQVSIMISDVPDHALDSLASGPTMPDSTTVDDCHSIIQRYNLLPKLPAPVRELLAEGALEETPKSDDPVFYRSRWWPILSNATALQSAAAEASAAGFAVEVDNGCDDWDYQRTADYLLERLRQLRRGVSKVALISGGEVTVTVGEKPGVGGRNQQFALYCATRIAGDNIAVLSAGTDGIDGNSTAAGAVTDGTTVQRACEMGLDPQAALRTFDAYPLLSKLGDTIETGPTGNNVRDVRILLAY